MKTRLQKTILERASVRNSITNLRSFPYIANLENRRELSLHGAWFDIAEGELWDDEPVYRHVRRGKVAPIASAPAWPRRLGGL